MSETPDTPSTEGEMWRDLEDRGYTPGPAIRANLQHVVQRADTPSTEARPAVREVVTIREDGIDYTTVRADTRSTEALTPDEETEG